MLNSIPVVGDYRVQAFDVDRCCVDAVRLDVVVIRCSAVVYMNEDETEIDENANKGIQVREMCDWIAYPYRYASCREISVSISCLNILDTILSKHSSSDNLNMSHFSL